MANLKRLAHWTYSKDKMYYLQIYKTLMYFAGLLSMQIIPPNPNLSLLVHIIASVADAEKAIDFDILFTLFQKKKKKVLRDIK